jgi:hypothetical protein
MSKRDLLIAGIAVVLAGGYLWYGSTPDPKFRLSRLRGLTARQVSTRLGEPELKWHADGKLVFGYANDWPWRWRLLRYAVIFRNDHVVDVTVSEK